MNLQATPEFLAFVSTYFPESDPEVDEQVARDFVNSAPADRTGRIANEIRKLLADAALPMDEFGSEANRWFGDAEEARAWLQRLLGAFEAVSNPTSSGVAVKDSNGALLSEGDSVQVIKDLKVKGGSSDLKRGTLIKKIHLTDDPENIECRFNGSTLVLKTCFLKKA